MTIAIAVVATAALFALFGFLALRCDCSGTQCAGCPHKTEVHHER